jgi:hypothetical protein
MSNCLTKPFLLLCEDMKQKREEAKPYFLSAIIFLVAVTPASELKSSVKSSRARAILGAEGLGRNIASRFDYSVEESKVMKITDYTAIQSYLVIRNYDHLITLGYLAFAIVAVDVLCFASSRPGVTEAELATATVLP